MSKVEHLRTELEEQIKRFERESDKHKYLYRKLRYSVFGLTGFSTVLASVALGFTGSQPLINVAVVLTTAAAGVITSIEGLRKPSELWILERNIFYALKDLKREIEYKVAEGAMDLDADMYFNRMQGILTSSIDKWSGQVQPSKQPKA